MSFEDILNNHIEQVVVVAKGCTQKGFERIKYLSFKSEKQIIFKVNISGPFVSLVNPKYHIKENLNRLVFTNVNGIVYLYNPGLWIKPEEVI